MELGNMLFGNSRGEHEVPRGWQDIFCTLLDALSMDYHGEGYENNVFIIRPYFWGDDPCPDDGECPCGNVALCQSMKPNFVFKPSGYELRWYKYPLRDSYANKELTRVQFFQMIGDCIRSIEVKRL